MKKILLMVAFVATVFNSVSAQMEYGNTTTALTGVKTWDFSTTIDGLTEGDMKEACTIDNLYFGCSTDNYINYSSSRISLFWNANQTFLADDSEDGVLSFKVPKGEGTLVINAKTAAKARSGGVFLNDQLFTDSIDSIRGTTQQDWTYNIKAEKESSIYITGLGKLAKKKGMYIYSIAWTPGSGTTGISDIKAEGTKNEDDNYYTLDGVKVASLHKGVYIHKGKKIVKK